MSGLHDAAVKLAEQGFYVFPLKIRGKAPIYGGGFKMATADPDIVSRVWRKHPDANIGLHPSRSKHLVIDLDGPRGIAAAEQLGFLDQRTLAVRTGRPEGGKHLYFDHPGGIIPNLKIGEAMDVRANNGYVVAPPSTHPSGAVYQWEGDLSDIRALTDRELAILRKDAGATSTRTTPYADKVEEPGRNVALTSYVGRLFASGMSDDEVLALAHAFGRDRCEPPMEEKEVTKVVYSISKAEAEKQGKRASVIEKLNETHAFVIVGDKSAILEEEPDREGQILAGIGFRLLTLTAFKDKLRPQRVQLDDKPYPLSEYWLNHKQRREYDRVVFAPEQTVERAYNMWRGFAVEPNSSGDCRLFLDHVQENVCQGKEELFLWVMGWFAQMIQEPTVKPGTSLVLRGPQGAGKTIVGKTIGFLLGPHYVSVADSRFITGRFNGHLAIILLLQSEEAFWAGDHAAEGKIKDLITGEINLIEFKNKEPIRVPNYVRLLVTSNAEWIVPAGAEERRFAVLDVGSRHAQDTAYFKAIEDQLRSGGYGALLHYLQTFDLSRVNLRQIPETAALFDQKLASLSSERQWLLDILTTGRLPGDKKGEGFVTMPALYQHYVEHAQRVGARRRVSLTKLGMIVLEHFPERTRHESTYTDPNTGEAHRCTAYQFPSLTHCRDTFAKAIRYRGGWDGPTDWVENGF